MPFALTVNAPKIDQSTIENSNTIIAAIITQPVGVVIGKSMSNRSGERNLFNASLLKMRFCSVNVVISFKREINFHAVFEIFGAARYDKFVFM